MKIFAFVWTLLFLLTVIPVMRLDHRRHINRLWREIRESTISLAEAFIYLGVASNKASTSVKKFVDTFQLK